MLHARPAFSRRRFLAGAAGAAFAAHLPLPAFSQAAARPVFTHGVQSGDVDTELGHDLDPGRPPRAGVGRGRHDRELRRPGPARRRSTALPESDLAVKRLLEGLPSDQEIFYRMVAADLADVNLVSEPIVGRFRTAPASRRSVRFAWSGDTVGQGWGIDAVGMKTYATIAGHEPDFFLHSGDTIYADGPIERAGRAATTAASGPTSC